MKLAEYMALKGVKDREVSEGTGLHISTVCRLRKDGQIPLPQAMNAIYQFTGGKVSANDFYGHKPVK